MNCQGSSDASAMVYAVPEVDPEQCQRESGIEKIIIMTAP